ncbi:GTPase Era [Pelagibacterales bacterium SAG-MED31]|nr:GTPase Era [Pelagibacterales bacterium SAG-MED31]
MKNKIIKISIVGRTNAGKSTLINQIVGEKISIQNKKINTTQETIIGVKNIKDTQFLFYDTPGSNFLKSLNSLSIKLKKNLWNGIDESDLILYMIDASLVNLNFVFDQLEKIKETKKKIIIAFNKTDLILNKKLLPIISKINQVFKIESFFTLSVKKNIGIYELLKEIDKYAYPSKWIYTENEITDKDDKFFLNELLRESMLTFLHKEIPYNINIITSNFKILKNSDIKIKQKIYFKEKRYKKIILGKKGSMIKKIREDCQNKITKFFSKKIHLYLELIPNDRN